MGDGGGGRVNPAAESDATIFAVEVSPTLAVVGGGGRGNAVATPSGELGGGGRSAELGGGGKGKPATSAPSRTKSD